MSQTTTKIKMEEFGKISKTEKYKVALIINYKMAIKYIFFIVQKKNISFSEKKKKGVNHCKTCCIHFF